MRATPPDHAPDHVPDHAPERPPGHATERAKGWRGRWPLLRRTFFIVFALVVIGLLIDQARHVEWQKVLEAVQSYTWPVLLRAAGLALLGYLIYSCFDLLAIPYLGHMIAPLKVMAVGIVAYAFNLNLGSLVGSVGFRLRLYMRLGLSASDITRIIGLSLTTNWLGHLWVAGGLFAWGALPLPRSWDISHFALRIIGMAMLIAALAYVLVCALARKRSWTIRGHHVELPSLGIALAQSVLGGACWVSIGLVVWSLVPHDVSFALILGALLLSGIAGAVTHIPGGLGVLEAVFVAMLGGQLRHYEILGALLAYRAVFYLGPFVLAAVLYFFLETRLPRLGSRRAVAGRHGHRKGKPLCARSDTGS